jgi:ABC-type transporter Mla subunit MlaD
MTAEKSYARLGLFIVLTAVVMLGTAIFFIQRLKNRAAIGMVTYTTENVFGLDVSSAVRLRGVPVGRVTGIRVNPRGEMVEIDFDVFVDRLNTIGLNVRRLRTITDVGGVFPKARAHIMGNPLTGEAYLLLDQPQNPPPPMQLGFKPTRPYIPSTPSIFGTVHDQLPALLDHANAMLQTLNETVLARVPDKDRLPALLDRANATIQTLNKIITRIPDTLDRSDRFFTSVDRIMRESQIPTLSAESQKFFTTTSAQIKQLTSEMDGLVGTEGALVKFTEEARAAIKAADLPAATQSAHEAAENSKLMSDDLRRSLPAIRDSLERLRELSRLLEEQPESIIYGERSTQRKH